MLEERLPGRGQDHPTHAAGHQRDADFFLEGTDLAAQRRLRRVQPFLRGERHTALLGDRDGVAKMPQLHLAPPCLVGMNAKPIKSFVALQGALRAVLP